MARALLRAKVLNSHVHDVQTDPRFQHQGVDILWHWPDGQVVGVEVKGDRQSRHGNYFFELVSNLEKNTPGCFLYSRADVLLYIFLETGEFHWLPMSATREWFIQKASDYSLRHTHTRVGLSRYTTVGAVVPTRDVQAAVALASRFTLQEDGTVGNLPARRPGRTQGKLAEI